MRVHTFVLSACFVAAVGCVTESTAPDESVAGQGIAELRVDAQALAALPLTRVLVEAGGLTQELVFNMSSNSFDGAVLLPGGPTTIVARAFSDDTLIGASSATPVNVEVGVVTRVLLRIVDLRPEMPTFGPVFDSLSFPTSIEATSPVTFAIAVLAPAGDPVSYSWTSNCADAAFGSPAAATTSWVKPTPGTCAISVVATSNGFSVSQQFNVVVFPAGTQSGALDVSGAFITAPQLSLSVESACSANSFGGNASCAATFAAPEPVDLFLSTFGWGLSAPGTLSLSDNCGGKFATIFQSSDALSAVWLPPLAGGLCLIKATGVNGDGGVGTVTIATLTRPGTLASGPPPQISAFLSLNLGGCGFTNTPGAPAPCGFSLIGGTASVNASAFAPDFLPAELSIDDDCGGGPPDVFTGTGSSVRIWTTDGPPDSFCTVTVRATSFQGAEAIAQAVFQLL